MRSDFWHRVAEAPLLAELLSDRGAVLDLWPPSPAEIAEIIRGPTAKAGVHFGRDDLDVALDARLADDAAREPGALPLLSYALDELYRRDRRNGGADAGRIELRWETYRDIGFLKGAITRRADEMIAELARYGVDDRAVARVLRHLVSLDESDGDRPVARNAPLFLFAEGTPERLLIDAFLRPDMRLLVAEGDAVEARLRVAHEALLTEWERAHRLIAEDAVNLSRRRLEEAERHWRSAAPAERSGLLLRPGLELHEAEALVAAWSDEIALALRDYITRSQEAEHRRIAEREEAARQLADRLSEAQLNQSRFLTSVAAAELRDIHIERAMLIARAALPVDMRKPDRPIWNGAFVLIADARARDRAIAVMVGHGRRVASAAFSPDGARIVAASEDGTARLWDGQTGAPLAILEGHRDGVTGVAFSPDGTRLVTASADRTARLWDGQTGAPLAILEGHRDGVTGVAFSPDGARAVTASYDDTARLWDGRTGAALAPLEGHQGGVTSAAFSPDGARIITTSDDRTARLWNGQTGALLALLEGHQDAVWSAAFGPDGARIVTASNDRTARLWPAWPLLRDDTAGYVAIAAVRILTPEERLRAFIPAPAIGTVEATPEPDRHRQLAEGFERSDGAGRDFERALFHYAVAVRLYEEQGREDEARLARIRRGSLARLLPPQTAARIAYKAMDWTPAGPR